MDKKEMISLEDALKAAQITIQKAESDDGGPIAITIVGSNGQPIVTLSMDGVIGISPRLSWRKAFTSFMTGGDTIKWEKEGINPQNFGGDEENITCFGGGVVLMAPHSNQVVGAIGVSGRKSYQKDGDQTMQDHELAVFCAIQLRRLISCHNAN